MAKIDLDFIASGKGMFNIIPDDANDLELLTRGIYIGEFGTLHVRMADGSEGTYGALIAGMVHPLQIIRVFASGTTADDIRGII